MSSLFFAVLKPAEKEKLLSVCEEVEVKRGDVILKKDEVSTDMYFIAVGSAKAIDEWEEEQVPLAMFNQGDVFGEMSFIYEGARSATVVAAEDSLLRKMTKETFIRFMVEEPYVAARFLFGICRVLVQRLRFADDAFTTLAVMNKDLKAKTETMKQTILGTPPGTEENVD
jgi:CRP-like cAMP-binding protein